MLRCVVLAYCDRLAGALHAFVFSVKTTLYFLGFNRLFYSCLLSALAFKWQRGWRRPCFDTDLSLARRIPVLTETKFHSVQVPSQSDACKNKQNDNSRSLKCAPQKYTRSRVD